MSPLNGPLTAPTSADASFELVEALYERLERASAALQLLGALLCRRDATDVLAEYAALRADELLRELPELY